ncbi:MAG: hypothetical protein ABH834_08010 [Candidatus Altiarchaeota archaeon]
MVVIQKGDSHSGGKYSLSERWDIFTELVGNPVMSGFLERDRQDKLPAEGRHGGKTFYGDVLANLFSFHCPVKGGEPARMPVVDDIIDEAISEVRSMPAADVAAEGKALLSEYSALQMKTIRVLHATVESKKDDFKPVKELA